MASEAGVPPPWTPPLADEAPPQLVAFLYLLGRDLLPLGYMEKALMQSVQSGPTHSYSNSELQSYAERLARALSHQ